MRGQQAWAFVHLVRVVSAQRVEQVGARWRETQRIHAGIAAPRQSCHLIQLSRPNAAMIAGLTDEQQDPLVTNWQLV